ncbi:DsbA family protein [Streptomyces sp. NPDC086766]|uniref:DsbA family oxidoreductase n=1 Tax=Streptomyces sp. NPDC086766 TaxID=3365754 RepID=UPI0037F61043
MINADAEPANTASPSAAGLANSDRRTVTVWSDIGCPWATLALTTIHDLARQRGQDLVIDHRVFPLELFNRRPTPKPLLDDEVRAVLRAVPGLGWRPWTAPEYTYPVTTLLAMEAVQACKLPEVGGVRASDELDAALRRAFYEDSRCISVPAVILDIAELCPRVDTERLAAALAQGASRSTVYEQWKSAQRPEVQGSPHFFTPDGVDVHNPGATYHRDDQGLQLTHYDHEWADELLTSLGSG